MQLLLHLQARAALVPTIGLHDVGFASRIWLAIVAEGSSAHTHGAMAWCK